MISTLNPPTMCVQFLAAKTQRKWKRPDPTRDNAMQCTVLHNIDLCRRVHMGLNGFTSTKRSDCDTTPAYTHGLVRVGQDGAISDTKGTVSFFQIKYVKKALSLSLILLLVVVCFKKICLISCKYVVTERLHHVLQGFHKNKGKPCLTLVFGQML